MATEIWWLKGEDVFSPEFPASCHSQPLLPESKPKYRLWPTLRNYICIFINWYKYQTIKEDLIPWIGWQTLGTPASVWQKNNGSLCSKTWINSKPFFIWFQCAVNEWAKRAVRLRWECLFIINGDLSIVENTINSKCCVSRNFSCMCVRLTFFGLLNARISVSFGGLIAVCLYNFGVSKEEWTVYNEQTLGKGNILLLFLSG